MLAAIVDFETNGVDALARPTEFALRMIVTDDPHPNGVDYFSPQRMGYLIYDTDYPPQPEIILKITGITDEMLKEHGKPWLDVVDIMLDIFKEVGWPDFFVAHNAPFDQRFFKNELRRFRDQLIEKYSYEVMEKLINIPWVCSINDVDHPKELKCKKLSHLALDYGIPVNPNELHRASDDVALLAQLLFKAKVDWERVSARHGMPWVIIRAIVPHPKDDNGTGKDKAAANGFRWQNLDDQKFDKWWVKKVKECDIPQVESELGYAVQIVGRP